MPCMMYMYFPFPLSLPLSFLFPPLPSLPYSELLQVDLLEDLILSTCGSVSVFKLITADISDNDKSLLDDIFQGWV